MMLNAWPDRVVRRADLTDQAAMVQLLQRKSFIHRHLGWESPLSWLEDSPFYVLDSKHGIVSALGFPPDEDQISWLRVFAVRSGYPIADAWERLWPVGLSWMEENYPGTLINSLVMNNEMEKLLRRSDFEDVYEVVVLVWNMAQALWPEINPGLTVRDMRPDDFGQVYEIDQRAFELIWRNSMSQLRAAYQEAFSAKVIDLDGRVTAYQISTKNPTGGHLARLAVDPSYQQMGMATVLIKDLMEDFLDRGIVEITVNTQSNNKASLDLYQKFGFKRVGETYPVLQYKTAT